MNTQTVDAEVVGSSGEVGRPVPERDDLGPRLTPEQRARLISGGPNAGRVRHESMHYSFQCYSCSKRWERRVATADCPRCGTTNNYCAANAA